MLLSARPDSLAVPEHLEHKDSELANKNLTRHRQKFIHPGRYALQTRPW